MWKYSLLIPGLLYGTLCLYIVYQRPERLWSLVEKKYRGEIGRVYIVFLASFLIVTSFLYMLFLVMGLLPLHSG